MGQKRNSWSGVTTEDLIKIAVLYKSPTLWLNADEPAHRGSYQAAKIKDGTLKACVDAQKKHWGDEWEGANSWSGLTAEDLIKIAVLYKSPTKWDEAEEPSHRGAFKAAKRKDGMLRACVEAQKEHWGDKWEGSNSWSGLTTEDFIKIAVLYKSPVRWLKTNEPAHRGSYAAAHKRKDGTLMACVEAQKKRWGDEWEGLTSWSGLMTEDLIKIAVLYKSPVRWHKTEEPAHRGSYAAAKNRKDGTYEVCIEAQKEHWVDKWEGSNNWSDLTTKDLIKIAVLYKSPGRWRNADDPAHRGSYAAANNRKDGTLKACIETQKKRWGDEWKGGKSGYSRYKPGHFYIIANNSYVKVGISNVPKDRTKAMAKEHSGFILFISPAFSGQEVWDAEREWKPALNMGDVCEDDDLDGHTETMSHETLPAFLKIASRLGILSREDEKGIRIRYHDEFGELYFEVFPDELVAAFG